MTTLEELDIEVSKLELEPGDTVLLRNSRPWRPEEVRTVARQMKEVIPDGVKVIMVGPEYELQVVRQHEYACKCVITDVSGDHGTCIICGRSADKHRGGSSLLS